jgi:hypothetical protein
MWENLTGTADDLNGVEVVFFQVHEFSRVSHFWVF